MKYIIETKNLFGIEIPSFDYGYSVIEMADYYNWYSNCGKNDNVFYLNYKNFDNEINKIIQLYPKEKWCESLPPIYVGSVENCVKYYSLLGFNLKPLNIPIELWGYIDNEIFISNHLENNGHLYYNKDLNIFKCKENCFIDSYSGTEFKFFSKKIPINSEFRIFVLNGEIVGIKQYLGDINSKLNIKYCEKIAKIYSEYNKAFTLDVAVSIENRIERTVVIELHDFFSCGLYGWDDYMKIRKMMITSHRQILGMNLNYEK